MSRKPLLIALALLVLIGGGVAYLLLVDTESATAPDNTQNSNTTDNSQTTEQTNPSQSQANASSDGQYLTYKEGIIESTKGNKLLFFHAPWCPQCRALEEDIQKNGVPKGVAIIKVDYDSHQALRQKYGVTIQTTIVFVNDQGELVNKYVAYDTPTLKAVETNIFNR